MPTNFVPPLFGLWPLSCLHMTSMQSGTTTRSRDDHTDPDQADRPVRVLKFGGTSVTGAARLDGIARIVRSRLGECRPVLVV